MLLALVVEHPSMHVYLAMLKRLVCRLCPRNNEHHWMPDGQHNDGDRPHVHSALRLFSNDWPQRVNIGSKPRTDIELWRPSKFFVRPGDVERAFPDQLDLVTVPVLASPD